MKSPVLCLAGGLLILAGLLPFTRIEGPVVVPVTAAIVGAVFLVWAWLTRPKPHDRAAPDPAAPVAADESRYPRAAR